MAQEHQLVSEAGRDGEEVLLCGAHGGVFWSFLCGFLGGRAFLLPPLMHPGGLSIAMDGIWPQ